MTYNLVARYIKKYGALPFGTEVPFITKKYPGALHLNVRNFEEEVGDAFLRLYGIDIRHDIKIDGAAIVEIIDPNKKTRASNTSVVRSKTKSHSKKWGNLSTFGKFFRLLKWILYALLLFLMFVGILVAYHAIKEAG